MRPINRVIVEREIDALMIACPEMVDDENLRHDMLQAETDAFKLLNVLVRRIGTCEAFEAGLAAYVMDIRDRKDRYERKRLAMREMIRKLMDHANLAKAEIDAATISIKRGAAKVIVSDETVVPDEFCRIKKEPNKTAIKASLESGAQVPGCTLSNAEPIVSIRVK
jgi:hypothetical protein